MGRIIYKVKELPESERPREKLLLKGSQNLSNAELLSILLRTGMKGKSAITIAQELLVKYSDLATIASLSIETLKKIQGIGKDKATALVAAFEISRRINFDDKWFSKIKIVSPKDIANIFIPLLRDELKENFIVVSLSSANKIIRYNKISVGNLNSSIVHPREVFKVAIENNSANIVLLHNHPSGNPKPSDDDIKITKQLLEAGKIIGISVLDHIIIAGENYMSFSEKKII